MFQNIYFYRKSHHTKEFMTIQIFEKLINFRKKNKFILSQNNYTNIHIFDEFQMI